MFCWWVAERIQPVTSARDRMRTTRQSLSTFPTLSIITNTRLNVCISLVFLNS